MPAVREKDICRFDVAVDDPRGVRRLQRVDDLEGKPQQYVYVERPVRDSMLQRRAVEELHDDERAAGMIADVVNGADVRVIQRGSGARFAPNRVRCRGRCALE